MCVTKGKASSEELEAGYSVTVAGKITWEARRAAGKAPLTREATISDR